MLPANCATGYIEEQAGWRSNIFALPVIGAPDGGAFSSVEDTNRFWQALREFRLLEVDNTGRLLYPHVVPQGEGDGMWYGYGVWIDRLNKTSTGFLIQGWDPGVACMSGMRPDEELVISIPGNTNRPVWPIYRAIRANQTSA